MSNNLLKAPEASLIIPAFNEAKARRNLEATLTNAHLGLEREFGSNYELLLADDGSSDATIDIARQNGASVLALPHKGKGAAVRAGILHSQARYRAFMDADNSFRIDDVVSLIDKVSGPADVAIATRHEGLDTIGPHASRTRAIFSKALANVCEVITPTGVKDTQCGAKAFKGEVAQDLYGRSVIDGFAGDREVLHLAYKLGYSVVEQACHVTPQPGSKVRPLQDGVSIVRDAVRIRRRAASQR